MTTDQRVLLPGRLTLVHTIRTAGQVNHGLCQRLVKRYGCIAEPANANLVAERRT